MSGRAKKTGTVEMSKNGLTIRVVVEVNTSGRRSTWTPEQLNRKAESMVATVVGKMGNTTTWEPEP